MYYVVESDKDLEQASLDLEKAIEERGYQLLNVHDMGEMLRDSGRKLDDQCRIFDIYNAKKTWQAMHMDMKLNMALPCRISIFTEDGGRCKIGTVKAKSALGAATYRLALGDIARMVDKDLQAIIDKAA